MKKRKSPITLEAGETGDNRSAIAGYKITKKKRMKRSELVYKWQSGSKYLHFVRELS